jgi:hypoxanthine phosphoribosyltransferase
MPPTFPRCRRTTWDEADRWAETVAEKVRAAHRLPKSIVGLTRGGWVPARLLADQLGVHRLVSLRAQHWGVTATPSGRAVVTEGLSGPVAGEEVLVVDDITDTGESLELAVDLVRKAGAARVESASFLHIAHSKFLPTYYAEEIPRGAWVWVVFPWNYWEDLAHLAGLAFAESHDIAKARGILSERCGLDVPEADIARAVGRAP